MKLTTTLALAATLFAFAVPSSLAGSQPDAFERYLRNNEPTFVRPSSTDAFDRYLRNNAPQSVNRAARHPDSLAVRPTVGAEPVSLTGDGRDWGTAALGALGGILLALAASSGAIVARDRRRLALH